MAEQTARQLEREPFRVAFVCTGNQARSPLAEALFRRYSSGFDVIVESWGTGGATGTPPLPLAIEEGRRRGVDLSAHHARRLRRGVLALADLVCGFESFHVSAAVVDGGARRQCTFLLGEIVPLLGTPTSGDDQVARARDVVATADSRRDRARLGAAPAIEDPFGRPAEVMGRVGAEVDTLVQRLVVGLLGEISG